MQRVLIGIGAAIVLAGAVLAVVYYSSHSSSRQEQAAYTPRNGWVPAVATVMQHGPNSRVAGVYDAWRVICSNAEPRRAALPNTAGIQNIPGVKGESLAAKGRCGLVLVMRNTRADREWLDIRLQPAASGPGAIITIVYKHGHGMQTFLVAPSARGDEVDIKPDGRTFKAWTQICFRGSCIAKSRLSLPDLNSVLSAQTLVIELNPAEPKQAVAVYIPIDGLKAAFAAMQQQPA